MKLMSYAPDHENECVLAAAAPLSYMTVYMTCSVFDTYGKLG